MKFIKLDNKVIVILDSGVTLEKEDVSTDEFMSICDMNEDEIKSYFCPNISDKIKEKEEVEAIVDNILNSKLLTKKNNAVYWEEVSQLSIPKELVESILEAEKNNDEVKIETYRNFWTLMSLNTDKECRDNLYWFLKLHGLVISKCGFFVAYRNVDTTDEKGVYTDHHSHTFKIRIGEMVTLDRSKCDTNSANECSRGLHCASVKWLKNNYFGSQGLAVLVNPKDVVAVPHNSEYGKLRTCAYLPIKHIEYNCSGNVIPIDVQDGFDCEYVPKVIYEGIMGTEIDSTYKIEVPDIPELNRVSIQDKLLDIALKCITDKCL